MVEFKQELQRHSRTAIDYWMLDKALTGADARRYLDLKGVAYKKTSPLSRLHELHARVQRGLPVYDKYTLQELRSRCRDFTPVSGTQSSLKSQMIGHLESKDDDDEPGFGKLMDLPPELRVEIFKHYFADVMADLDEHYAGFLTPPPITEASKILRKEALDVFFKCCTMSICIEQLGCICSHFVTTSTTRDSLERAPIEYIQAFRKLRLEGTLDVPHEILSLAG